MMVVEIRAVLVSIAGSLGGRQARVVIRKAAPVSRNVIAGGRRGPDDGKTLDPTPGRDHGNPALIGDRDGAVLVCLVGGTLVNFRHGNGQGIVIPKNLHRTHRTARGVKDGPVASNDRHTP